MVDFIQPNGDVISLRQREPLISAEKIEQVQELMGRDELNISVVSEIPLSFAIGGSVLIFGKKYTMNQVPKEVKNGMSNFGYDLVLEGTQYELRRPVYFNTDITGFKTTSEFPITGNIELFIDVLINNCNRLFGVGKWTKGEVPVTAVKPVQFSEQNNCLACLQQICKAFDQEFDIIQTGPDTRVIHIRKAGEVLGDVFQYGRGNGLYTLTREKVNEADIFTRVYPYGASKNLKPGYRNFAKRLTIGDPGYIQDDAAIAKYGLIEKELYYDTVFPNRTGGVSSVLSYLSFTDASMNFDLNASSGGGTTYIVPGTAPKVSFISGNLAGYEFLVDKYVNATKTFTLIPMKDERGYELPSNVDLAFKIQAGDTYKLIDINMPDEYTEVAEAELLNLAQQDLEVGVLPKVQYSLKIDEVYLLDKYGDEEYYNVFSIGDYIPIYDPDLGIDSSSRIIKFTRDGINQYNYELTLSDTYQVELLVQIIESQQEVKAIIAVNKLTDLNRTRRGIWDTYELFNNIFDTDGQFDGSRIKPLSIETGALVVGFKSQQYALQDVLIEANYGNFPNVVHATSGKLIHFTIASTNKTWNLDETTVTIGDDNLRYIYAKVLKAGTTGTLIFSSAQITVDQDPNYYHFMVGMLHSVIDGTRGISLSYGMTAIDGGFIRTGTIGSFDGLTYFNLATGVIAGKIKFRDYKGNYRDMSDIGADMEGFFKAAVINEPSTYLFNKVTAWFQSTPPVWPTGEDAEHEGDSWFKSNTGSVWRYVAGDWVPEADAERIASYASTFIRVGDDTKVRLFVATPEAPYNETDLWMSPEGLRRSIANKVMGQPFDINDWVEPFNFDNTETTIDKGIITSGIIQLAGDKYNITAGVSGIGNLPTSVRFFAGASTLNMNSAPFRVFQSGEVIARKRIEVEGLDIDGETYIGQAGLCGQVELADGDIRIYAGKNYANRATAYFRVNHRGYVWMERGQIGNLRIENGGLTNRDSDNNFYGHASIVFRNDTDQIFVAMGTNVLPASSGIVALARFQNSTPSADLGHIKIAAWFSASGGSALDAQNIAIYAMDGISMFGEILTNGRKTRTYTIAAGAYIEFDPTLYDLLILSYGAGARSAIKLKSTGTAYPLKNGCEFTIQSTNNAQKFNIQDTIRNNAVVEINAGSTITLQYSSGFWYIKSAYDNAF